MRAPVWWVVVALCVACDEPPEVEQERAQLEAQLLERQVVLADLELFQEGVDALGRRVRAMRAQLGEVNLPLLRPGPQ